MEDADRVAAMAVVAAINNVNRLNRRRAPLRTVVWDVDGTLVPGAGWNALRRIGPQVARPVALWLALTMLRRQGVTNVVVSRNMGFVFPHTHVRAEFELRSLGFDAVVQGFRDRAEPKTQMFGCYNGGCVLVDDHMLECEAAISSGATALKVPAALGVIDGVMQGRTTPLAAQSTFM